MKHRKLRIAWSVVWGILCLLLISLWVRSYSCWMAYHDEIGHIIVGGVVHNGTIDLPWTDLSKDKSAHLGSGYVSYPDSTAGFWEKIRESFVWFRFRRGPTGFSILLPMWFPIMVSFGLAVVPWIQRLSWRFSLRTLLIGMTVAAIGLGWLVYWFK
jgi:hypothetical protein